jgi:hypothetical protein
MYGQILSAMATSGAHIEDPSIIQKSWLVIQRDRYENMTMSDLRLLAESGYPFRVPRKKSDLIEALLKADSLQASC